MTVGLSTFIMGSISGKGCVVLIILLCGEKCVFKKSVFFTTLALKMSYCEHADARCELVFPSLKRTVDVITTFFPVYANRCEMSHNEK